MFVQFPFLSCSAESLRLLSCRTKCHKLYIQVYTWNPLCASVLCICPSHVPQDSPLSHIFITCLFFEIHLRYLFLLISASGYNTPVRPLKYFAVVCSCRPIGLWLLSTISAIKIPCGARQSTHVCSGKETQNLGKGHRVKGMLCVNSIIIIVKNSVKLCYLVLYWLQVFLKLSLKVYILIYIYIYIFAYVLKVQKY